jgi:hypothetical protein
MGTEILAAFRTGKNDALSRPSRTLPPSEEGNRFHQINRQAAEGKANTFTGSAAEFEEGMTTACRRS